jgi:hypothetical protein
MEGRFLGKSCKAPAGAAGGNKAPEPFPGPPPETAAPPDGKNPLFWGPAGEPGFAAGPEKLWFPGLLTGGLPRRVLTTTRPGSSPSPEFWSWPSGCTAASPAWISSEPPASPSSFVVFLVLLIIAMH